MIDKTPYLFGYGAGFVFGIAVVRNSR